MNRRTAVFSIAAGAVGLYADDKQPKKLTDAELEKLLRDEKNLFFLDVREPKEIQDLGSISVQADGAGRDTEYGGTSIHNASIAAQSVTIVCDAPSVPFGGTGAALAHSRAG
jgi:hypothetical protein